MDRTALQRFFNTHKTVYFNDHLEDTDLVFNQLNYQVAAEYHPDTDTIILADGTTSLPDDKILLILLHEMTHAYIANKNGDSYREHQGPWDTKMEDIGMAPKQRTGTIKLSGREIIKAYGWKAWLKTLPLIKELL